MTIVPRTPQDLVKQRAYRIAAVVEGELKKRGVTEQNAHEQDLQVVQYALDGARHYALNGEVIAIEHMDGRIAIPAGIGDSQARIGDIGGGGSL